MSIKYFLAVILSFSSFNLFAQQFVDVFPDHICIQEKNDWDGNGIIKINFDSSAECFRLPVTPKGFDLKNLIMGTRPKIRFDNYWISDGREIYKRPLDAEPDQEWERVKVPGNIAQFTDFEIISDKEAIICGCIFKNSLDTHFVFNYKTGEVTTPIESFDIKSIPYELRDPKYMFAKIKSINSYICRFDSKIIIVGKYSGCVTVLDINPDNNKLRRFRKIQIIPESEIPKDPQDALNNDEAISWIGSLFGGDVLICCRMWIVPKRNPSEARPEYCFRTLNLDTGKVTFEGASYRDRMAESHLTLYEDDKGKLLSVREVISERLKQIEQIERSKKLKSAPTPKQSDKQSEQLPPDTEPTKQSKQIELNSDVSVK